MRGAASSKVERVPTTAGYLPTTARGGPYRNRSPAQKSSTSVAIELDQPLVADPEVMRDLVEHDVPDLAA